MKKFLSLLYVLLLCACHQEAVYLSEQDSGRRITLEIGQTAVITLPENQTTGYSWLFEVTPEEQDIIGNIKEKYIHQKTKLVGSGGVKEFSFKAQNTGKADIYGYYRRPWEELDKKTAQSVHFTIIIK